LVRIPGALGVAGTKGLAAPPPEAPYNKRGDFRPAYCVGAGVRPGTVARVLFTAVIVPARGR